MTEYEIYKWAVKGIRAEIDKLEKSVTKGKQYLLEYEKGGQPKTPKTPDEIRQIIQEKKEEIEQLDKQRFNLEWKITELYEK